MIKQGAGTPGGTEVERREQPFQIFLDIRAAMD